jgi:FKBP-type peptidyl-prolyl cis-trans isomerase
VVAFLIEEENKVQPVIQNVLSTIEIKNWDEVSGWHTEPMNGDLVSLHYVGTFDNGEQFDSSRQTSTPLEFTIGNGSMIQW